MPEPRDPQTQDNQETGGFEKSTLSPERRIYYALYHLNTAHSELYTQIKNLKTEIGQTNDEDAQKLLVDLEHLYTQMGSKITELEGMRQFGKLGK